MKYRFKTIASIAILLVVSIWAIDKIPFNKSINQQITANIYENGVAVGQTVLTMTGEKSRYLFRKNDGFIGQFLIPYAEKTNRNDLQTYIKWNGEDNTQSIRYFYKGEIKLSEDMGVVPYLLINNSMTEFAMMLTDQTVIATSDELYDLYTKHITWHSNTRSTSIIGTVPKID